MRKLIMIIPGASIGIILATALFSGDQTITVIIGCICIFVTIVVVFMAKRSFKSTKG